MPLPDHKTTADYMEGLFHLELKLQPETGDRRAAQIVNLDQQAATYEMSGAEDAATMSYTSSLEEVASQSIKTNPVSGYLEADRSSGRMKAATENGLSHANLEFSQINITTRARNEPEDPDRMLRADAVSSATVRTSQRMVISDEKAQQPTLPASYRRLVSKTVEIFRCHFHSHLLHVQSENLHFGIISNLNIACFMIGYE